MYAASHTAVTAVQSEMASRLSSRIGRIARLRTDAPTAPPTASPTPTASPSAPVVPEASQAPAETDVPAAA